MADDQKTEAPPDGETTEEVPPKKRKKANPPQWLVVFVEESDDDKVPQKMTTQAGPMDRASVEKKAAELGASEDVEDGTDILCIRLGLRGKRGTKKKTEREVKVIETDVPAFETG